MSGTGRDQRRRELRRVLADAPEDIDTSDYIEEKHVSVLHYFDPDSNNFSMNTVRLLMNSIDDLIGSRGNQVGGYVRFQPVDAACNSVGRAVILFLYNR